jgi:hypothetical protein
MEFRFRQQDKGNRVYSIGNRMSGMSCGVKDMGMEYEVWDIGYRG